MYGRIQLLLMKFKRIILIFEEGGDPKSCWRLVKQPFSILPASLQRWTGNIYEIVPNIVEILFVKFDLNAFEVIVQTDKVTSADLELMLVHRKELLCGFESCCRFLACYYETSKIPDCDGQCYQGRKFETGGHFN
jgi:hypothetical protein